MTEISLTPLTSQKEAGESIAKTRRGLQKGITDQSLETQGDADSSRESSDAEAHGIDGTDDDVEDHLEADTPPNVLVNPLDTSVAEDVISKRGGYGRFTRMVCRHGRR